MLVRNNGYKNLASSFLHRRSHLALTRKQSRAGICSFTGMLPTQGRAAKFVGRLGAEFDVQTGRKAAHLAALNALAVVRQQLGSLDRVARLVRLGCS